MRIVAGRAKGRRLAPPAGATRPTSDRVREALFSSVGAALPLEGARVLDLFAGTGAVGLEAASRGAARVVLVESDRRALAVVRRNVATVALPGVEVVASPVTRFLDRQQAEPFDVVFADPPYALGDAGLTGVLDAVLTGGWLAPGGFLLVERSSRAPAPSATVADDLDGFTARSYGETVLWYGRRR